MMFLWHAYIMPQCFSMRTWISSQVTHLSEGTPDMIIVYSIWKFIGDYSDFPVGPNVVGVKL